MSLITKMLTDLDKRLATAGEGQPQFVGVRLPARSRLGNVGPLPLVAALVAALALAAWAWTHYHKAPTPVAQGVPVLPAASGIPVAAQASPRMDTLPPPAPPATPMAASAATSRPTELPLPAKPEGRTTLASKSADPVSAPVPESRPKPVADNAAPTLVLAENRPAKVAPASPAEGLRHGRTEPGPVDGATSPFKVVSPKQRSDNFYRQALSSIQQSRTAEAQQALRQAIAANPANDDARLLLAEMLINSESNAEAATLLRHGLELEPTQRAGSGGLSMALARLQLAQGAKSEALATLEHGLPSARGDADYHAFLAALLQGQGRHAEAAQQYITALRSNPAMPSWLIGVGISLQAENKMSDAAEAFQRAIDTGELSPELTQFAEERLMQTRQKR